MVRQYESHADPVLASLHRPDVGYVVFEDDFQIVAEPFADRRSRG
jgi:hypothetical protein